MAGLAELGRFRVGKPRPRLESGASDTLPVIVVRLSYLRVL